MANELNEQLNAAPEPEMRESAPAMQKESVPAADANEPSVRDMSAEASNDAGNTPSPVIRLVDAQNLKTFSYGDDGAVPGMENNGAKHDNQAKEAIDAIRKDITLIAVGSTQMSANQNSVSRQAGNDANHTSVRGQQDLMRQLAEQRRIEAWNNTQTTVGGVSMTNAQAQAARKNVIENDERYADWAVEKGYIRADQKDEFKKAAKEMYELKEAEKRQGKMTDDQQRRFDELQRSPVGQAADKATAHAYQNPNFFVSNDAAIKQSIDNGQPVKLEAINKAVMAPPVNNDSASGRSSGSAAKLVASSGLSDDIDLTGGFNTTAKGTQVASQPQPAPGVKIAAAGPNPG